MIINKVLGSLESFTINAREVEKVYMEWFELEKKRIKKTTEKGEEIGIAVDLHLKNHDVLYADEQKIIVIEQLPCDLTTITVENMRQMGRLCFELGNRHLSVVIEDHQVSVVYDEPTYSYLEKLGFHVEKRRGIFENYTICHAHGHTHIHNETHQHNHAS